MNITKSTLIFTLSMSLLLTACSPIQPPATPAETTTVNPTSAETLAAVTPDAATPTTIPFDEISFWVDPEVPGPLKEAVAGLSPAADSESASVRLGISEAGVTWVYALVTPFSSLRDATTLQDLEKIWKSDSPEAPPIFGSQSTIRAMESLLGDPGAHVQVTTDAEILAKAWTTPDAFAIIPFEQLEPRWKVITIDGKSPIHNDFTPESYPLKIEIGWVGDSSAISNIEQAVNSGTMPQLIGNRDPAKLTVLVMTGVTALVRATAVKMEEKGMTYPGEAIRDWLVSADLTHISNEVSFSPVCPDPVPYPGPLIFCSKPEYIELLDDVGTDILELTGNHGIDWGRDALAFSLDLYADRGWTVYASGVDAASAREAVTMVHNGNKLAFIGCNPAGPEFIWATETQSGVANCDYPWMWQRIQDLTAEGFQVISTFQYFETYRHYVEPFEERDFRSMADAGAVIVSGSQAHHPMAMEFYNGSFIHYGLGNLFFDQMHTGGLIPDATRKEFIDRHVFYNNQHISTELLTAMLEDYARPRPMTPAERGDFLKEIFDVTRWGNVPSK